MKPITIDNFISNLCSECGNDCPDLCICAETLKNMNNKYKIFSLATNIEIAINDYKKGEEKESQGLISSAMTHYKNAYKHLQKAEKEKAVIVNPEEPEEIK